MESLSTLALQALAASPDAIVVVSRTGEILFASDRMEAVFGYSPAELVGQPISLLAPPFVREAGVRARSEALTNPGYRAWGFTHPWYGRRKDGVDIPLEVTSNGFGAGEDVRLIYAMRDVSERRNLNRDEEMKELQARLTHAYDQFDLFVEHTPAAVALLDKDLRYLFASRRWREDHELTLSNVVGASHLDLFPNLSDYWRKIFERCLAGESFLSREATYKRANGAQEWIIWSMQPWRDAEGAIGGVAIFREIITARKLNEEAGDRDRENLERQVALRTQDLDKAVQEARAANAFKSRFLASASHDMRQPLQAIGIYTSLLKTRIADADTRALLAKSKQAVDALNNILTSLLDLAKLERGALEPAMRAFPVQELIDRVVAQFQVSAENKGLYLRGVATGVWAHSDPDLLERVLCNLVGNGVRYTETGGVEIDCAVNCSELKILVRDTGIGIPANRLSEIFDEFVQVDAATRPGAEGYGLGLSIARQVAALLGRRIEVESEVGRGTTFALTVPRAEPTPTTAAAPAEPPPTAHAGDGRILLIEDDDAVADATLFLLQDSGFDVRRAHGGGDAREIVDAGFKPDLLLSDYRLPIEDGPAIVQSLRSRLGPDLPALLLTGEAAVAADVEAALHPGQVLRKPLGPRDLLAAIGRWRRKG